MRHRGRKGQDIFCRIGKGGITARETALILLREIEANPIKSSTDVVTFLGNAKKKHHESILNVSEWYRQTITNEHYESSNQARCYKAVWRRYIFPTFKIYYCTSLTYFRHFLHKATYIVGVTTDLIWSISWKAKQQHSPHCSTNITIR